jgi:hypothetical protein
VTARKATDPTQAGDAGLAFGTAAGSPGEARQAVSGLARPDQHRGRPTNAADGETRDRRGHLVTMTVDGITYHEDDDRNANIPDGLFQIVRDGSRQVFPAAAMRTTPADLDETPPAS